MRHLRSDYDRFQDPAGKVPDDEPVFLLRGQDPAAGFAVHAYAVSFIAHGGDPEVGARIKEWSKEMKAYSEHAQHGPPDMPPGALR